MKSLLTKTFGKKTIPKAGYLVVASMLLIVSSGQAQRLASLHPAGGVSPALLQQEAQQLKTLLQNIGTRYQTSIVFEDELVQGKTVRIDDRILNPDATQIEDALTKILVPLGLSYRKLQHYFVIQAQATPTLEVSPVTPRPTSSAKPSSRLTKISPVALAQRKVTEQTITGQVTDVSTNETLPGVNVLVKGTTVGTVTNIDGNYRLTAPDDAETLVFSSVGYTSEEVAINGRSTINLGLDPDVQSLSEVVVIGYGTVKKSDFSGSVSSVEGEDLQTTPANTFVQSLQGRAPGVDVRAASNAPGGGIRVRIRGANSINASSDPLYVIDGFPIDNSTPLTPQAAGNNAFGADPLSSISPNDIESIEILKDASATAIYGARGANGVVIITTKRGEVGKPTIDFDYFLRVDNVRKTLNLANAQELAILNNEWAANNGRDPIYDGVNRPLPEELGEGTDWQDEIFRTALVHSYNLTVSGGSENTRYLVSGNYFDQDGIIIESNFKRGGLKFNLDQQVSSRLKFGVNLNANRTVNDAVPSDGTGFRNDSPLWNALTTTPVIPVVDEEGNYVDNHDETVKILENPVAIARTRSDITYTNRILGSSFADLQLTEGLTFRANFGADLITSKRNVYIPNTAETQALPNLGVASVGNIQSANWLQEYTLNYDANLGANHQLNAVVGYTVQTRNTEEVFSRTDDFFTNKLEFNNLGLGADPRPSTSNAVETALLSYLGRVNYVFRDKYIVTGTVRRDGSSKFGEDNKWGLFPSAAVAWRLGDEAFLQDNALISDLKLRASYGVTGNESISPYSSLSLYNVNRPIIGGAPAIGLIPNRIPNPDLRWERTAQFNVGVDAAFWEGRVNFTADYYVKRTNDLLLNVAIPNQSGYANSVQNIGEIENRGVELQLGFNNTFGRFRWRSSFNISFNRNELISLPDGVERLLFGIGRGESAHGRSIALPGQPLGLFYGYRFEGIWQTEEEIIEAGNTVGGVNRPGLPRYADLNGDGFQRNDDDREIVGDPNPDFIYGFSNDFSYGGFTLTVFINGVYGNEIADLNRIGLLAQPQKHNVLQQYFDERWTGPGTSNTIEAPLTNAGEWKNFSDRDVIDGSFLRVKTITLAYELPTNALGADWLRRAQVYVAGDNLITVTNYTGFDPEVDLYSSSSVQVGVDNGGYPAARSIRFGVRLGF
ncbi:SusC/RagA family TonB-linked outer membrane protein [Tunicatimonas pelagia]|uniref:SusC/RagA family TonB-linked outer membrane protein n=1 Tax=Tunicatimonas pelagia TaxID=931531 RepID=UPI00266522DE|nr:TonB-dependent receptor [Tunicatimonas pelagia]WKN45006.1 TonB-dependent receptor [Tunicatimonas pelagia]